jgi:hypothetical protein
VELDDSELIITFERVTQRQQAPLQYTDLALHTQVPVPKPANSSGNA